MQDEVEEDLDKRSAKFLLRRNLLPLYVALPGPGDASTDDRQTTTLALG